MKNRTVATILTAAGLSLGALPAAASQLGSTPRPGLAAEATGAKLAKALLPASDFGWGYRSGSERDTGKSTRSRHAIRSVSRARCSELGFYHPFFGQTAEAANLTSAPKKVIKHSGSRFLVGQDISQFASARAARAVFLAEKAKYQSCRSYSATVSDNRGTTKITVKLLSTGWTKIGSYPAYTIKQSATISDWLGVSVTVYACTKVVIASPDVYTMWQWSRSHHAASSWGSGAVPSSWNNGNDVPDWWLVNLIKRTQPL